MASGSAIAFFSVAVAYSIGWTAASSMLATYSWQFGPASFLKLNLAFFIPSLPVLFLQALYDTGLSRRLGLGLASALKMVFGKPTGLGSSAVVCFLLPFLMWEEIKLYSSVAVLGISSAIAFSSSYQLAPYFPDSANIALTAGFAGSGPLVLLFQMAGQIGPHASLWQAFWLFEAAAVLTLLGLIAFLALVRLHWSHLADSSPGFVPGNALLPLMLRPSIVCTSHELSRGEKPPSSPAASLPGQEDQQSGQDLHKDHAEVLELLARPHAGSPGSSTSATVKAIWPAAVSLFCSMAASMVIAPFFTYVPSSGWLGDMLPQAVPQGDHPNVDVLFAAKVVSDVVGRFLPLTPGIQSRSGLLLAGVVRLCATPMFFWYAQAASKCNMLNDAAIVMAVAIFWGAAGYANAAAYLMAATWAPPGGKERCGGLMTLVFQVACLLALLGAVAVGRSFDSIV